LTAAGIATLRKFGGLFDHFSPLPIRRTLIRFWRSGGMSRASLKICRKLRSVKNVNARVQEIVRRQSAFIAVGERDAREDRKTQNNCRASQDHHVIRPSVRHASTVCAHRGLAFRTMKTPDETVGSTR
jgi:hypothetical protein